MKQLVNAKNLGLGFMRLLKYLPIKNEKKYLYVKAYFLLEVTFNFANHLSPTTENLFNSLNSSQRN